MVYDSLASFRMHSIKLTFILFAVLDVVRRSGCDALATGTRNKNLLQRPYRIAVIGGGASGMFAATTAASTLKEHLNPSECDVQVHVYESTSKLMSKVLISGGGRCNVLHDTTKPLPKILDSYPRGSRELNGLYSKHFTPDDALEWFVSRGVVLKTESDGRMFPVTDSSQTIADCIYDDAMKNGVIVKKGDRVAEIQTLDVNDDDDDNNKCILFDVVTQTREKGEKEQEGHNLYDSIIMATGSAPKGHGIIEQMNVGHTIVQPVPSLFTFNAAKSQIKDHDGVLYDLSGLSLQNAKLSLKVSVPGRKKKKVVTQEGPLLITHRGISGPATLRLSAFAAREFHSVKYKTNIIINWAPELGLKAEEIEKQLWSMTTISPKKLVISSCPLIRRNVNVKDGDEQSSTIIPRRLWSALVLASGFGKDKIWAEAPKKQVGALARNIAEFNLDVTGKSVFKDEFVTAGGVKLKEITMKTMESKKCSGLYFCGEVIDVDGVTGGFNFMNCWSTGYMAGYNSALRLVEKLHGSGS